MSVGGFLREEGLWERCIRSGVRIYIPSGAIAGLDAGSAGSFLVATLANNDGVCPRCGKFVYLSERVHGFNFGAKNDLLDLETGEPVPNPDRSDESGTPLAI